MKQSEVPVPVPNKIIPPHGRGPDTGEHEHRYHVVIGGDVIVRWCWTCPVTDILERVGVSYGARGAFQSKWRRIEAAEEGGNEKAI